MRQQPPDDDTSDELRGHMLQLLWPSHLSVNEFLPLLTRRKDGNFYGVYYRFLEKLAPVRLAQTRGFFKKRVHIPRA